MYILTGICIYKYTYTSTFSSNFMVNIYVNIPIIMEHHLAFIRPQWDISPHLLQESTALPLNKITMSIPPVANWQVFRLWHYVWIHGFICAASSFPHPEILAGALVPCIFSVSACGFRMRSTLAVQSQTDPHSLRPHGLTAQTQKLWSRLREDRLMVQN